MIMCEKNRIKMSKYVYSSQNYAIILISTKTNKYVQRRTRNHIDKAHKQNERQECKHLKTYNNTITGCIKHLISFCPSLINVTKISVKC